MSRFVKCGKWKVSQSYADVVCDTTTGDLVVCDDLNGNCVISGIPSVPDPLDTEDSPAIDNILSKNSIDGAILTGRYLILIKDSVAVFSLHETPLVPEHKFDVDITVEFEDEIE